MASLNLIKSISKPRLTDSLFFIINVDCQTGLRTKGIEIAEKCY